MRPRWYVNFLILLYLALQVGYPIRGFLQDKFDAWGRFTWNMYSQSYQCRVLYRVVAADGTEWRVNYEQFFARRDRAGLVFNRESLPGFHKFVCERLAEEGQRGKLMATAECTMNRLVTESLVDNTADVCNSPNFAVTAG